MVKTTELTGEIPSNLICGLKRGHLTGEIPANRLDGEASGKKQRSRG